MRHLTLAHLLWALWLLVVVFYAAQYAGPLLLPGLTGEWHDPISDAWVFTESPNRPTP